MMYGNLTFIVPIQPLSEWPSTPISPSVEPDPVTNDHDSAPGDKDEKQDPPQASPEPEPIVSRLLMFNQ